MKEAEPAGDKFPPFPSQVVPASLSGGETEGSDLGFSFQKAIQALKDSVEG